MQYPVSQPVLTAEEVDFLNRFVDAYLVRYDAISAGIAAGLDSESAADYVYKILKTPYVVNRIRDLEDAKLDELSTTELEELLRRRVLTGLVREAHYHGADSTHGARVSALSKLASLTGMDKPLKTENVTEHRGGVMMVPAMTDPATWSANAQAQQASLVTHGANPN